MLLIIFSIFVGLSITKYFFFIIYNNEIRKIDIRNTKEFLGLILIPFFSTIFIKIKDVKKLRVLLFLSELLGGFSFLMLIEFLIKNVEQINSQLSNNIFLALFYILFTSTLLYLSIHDLLTYSIPEQLTRNFLFLIVLANLVIGFFRLLSKYTSPIILFNNIHLGFLDNLIAGVGIGILIWLIIKITKDKGLGSGDIDVMEIIGFSLGFPSILIMFLTTLVSGSLISIVYALIIRKFKNVIVPFIPFVLIGFLLTLNFGDQLWHILTFGTWI